MRVLIADDERLFCDLLEAYVQRCGHEVVAKVSTGGLAVIREFAEKQPDLVLLDVMMPKCNGLTVLHALRSRAPKCKVVLMSGIMQRDYPLIAASGANGFIRKPMLLRDVQELLDRMAAADSVGDVEAPPAGGMAVPAH